MGMFKCYTEEWLKAECCEEGYSYNPKEAVLDNANPAAGGFKYSIPTDTEHVKYRKYIESFPETDSPEIFGLHPNADLTFRVKEVTALFKTLGETQPKGGGGGGGVSREDNVYEKAEDFLEKLPEDYVIDDYKVKIDKKLGGMGIPLNIFLFQELQRLQNVIAKVRFTLAQLQLAIKGEVVMTPELQETLDSMFDAKVPHYWENTLTGDEFSWRLPTLGLWFTSLTLRDSQDRLWLNTGRPTVFWLTGFFNPNGCLTAMKQEVTRKHKKEDPPWALDDVIYHTEVTNADAGKSIPAPAEGINIHGLFLEGGRWEKSDGHLEESRPKELFTALPVLYVTGRDSRSEGIDRKSRFEEQGPYECPVYKYKSRNDMYFIFFANLKCTMQKNPNYWTMRGVALVCNNN